MCIDCRELRDDADLTALRQWMTTSPQQFPFLQAPVTLEDHARRVCFNSTRILMAPDKIDLRSTLELISRHTQATPPRCGASIYEPKGVEVLAVGSLGQLFLGVGPGNTYFLNFAAAVASNPGGVGTMPWLDPAAIGCLIGRFVDEFESQTASDALTTERWGEFEQPFHAAAAVLLNELADRLGLTRRACIVKVRRMLRTISGRARVERAWTAVMDLPAARQLREQLGTWAAPGEPKAAIVKRNSHQAILEGYRADYEHQKGLLAESRAECARLTQECARLTQECAGLTDKCEKLEAQLETQDRAAQDRAAEPAAKKARFDDWARFETQVADHPASTWRRQWLAQQQARA